MADDNWLCDFENCNKIATYGYDKGESLKCKTHKDDDMIITFTQEQFNKVSMFHMDKKYQMCIFKKCIKHAGYNFPGFTKRVFCSPHKLDGMRDVINKMCVDCHKVVPNYNVIGKTAQYCQKCSEKYPNMVEVKNPKCICGKHQPTFNYPTETNPKYCAECHLDGMKNIVTKKCQCQKSHPTFNFIGLKPKYCALCKQENMQDVKSNMCIICDEKQPTFNYANETKPTHCFKCSEGLNMINVVSKMCIVCNIITATFNYSNEKTRTHCAGCKLPDMQNIITKRCKNEWCDIFVNNKYNGYCFRCFIHMFPDNTISRNYAIKEKHMTTFIENKFKDKYDIKTDKTVGGCSKRRPDVFIDLFTHVLIIECDENQHKNYNTTCEVARINELFTDLGDRPIVFIRFNPFKSF